MIDTEPREAEVVRSQVRGAWIRRRDRRRRRRRGRGLRVIDDAAAPKKEAPQVRLLARPADARAKLPVLLS